MSSASRSRLAGGLGFRLTAGYGVLLTASLLCLHLLASWQLGRVLESRDRDAIRDEMAELLREYEDDGLRAIVEESDESAGNVSERPYFVQILNGDGAVLYSRLPLTPANPAQGLGNSEVDGDGGWSVITLREGMEVELLTRRLSPDRLIQVGASTDERRAVQASFSRSLTIVSFVVLVAALLLGVLATRRLLAPLRELAGVTKDIAATAEVGRRLAVRGGGDELDVLAGQFNTMLDRIETLLNGMRGTVDNVAHDLRTPLTRIRGRAELALNAIADGGSRDQADEVLAETIEDSDQILSILNAIMDEAEADAGTLVLTIERVSLGELASEVAELYEYVAEEKGVRIDLRLSSDVFINADRSRLRQALANLVDNAVKYSGEEGSVVIEVFEDGGFGTFRIRDSGPGIASHDLPRIWDRLYRGDPSRSTRGLGLGLSLVKAIVTAHEGTVEVSSLEGAGAVFVVRLPLASIAK